MANYIIDRNICPIELMDIRYNNIHHQRSNSECGVYSIHYLLTMLKGVSFESGSLINKPDKLIKKCRQVYFYDNV
jgi:hypothetical protein